MSKRNPRKTKSTDHISPVSHAIGGSIGSGLALLLLYPLERVRIEIQSQAQTQAHSEGDNGDIHHPHKTTQNKKRENLLYHIKRLYGRGELYRGSCSIVTTLVISNFVFFYVNSYLNQRNKSMLNSSIAGIINVLLTNPLWVANMRIIQQNKKCDGEQSSSSIWSTLYHIYKVEGLQELWNGTFASLLLVSNPVIQMLTYEQLKIYAFLLMKRRRASNNEAREKKNLSPLEAFVFGAISKALATVLTYPLQLAQTLLRLQKSSKTKAVSNIRIEQKGEDTKENSCKNDSEEFQDTFDCLCKLYCRDGGFRALYSGMNAKLTQTVLTSAFQFLTYEQILRLVAISIKHLDQTK